MADFEVDPVEGGKSRLTLTARATPWHIRIGGHDLLIEVDAGLGSAGLLETLGPGVDTPAEEPEPDDDGPIVVAPEYANPEDL